MQYRQREHEHEREREREHEQKHERERELILQNRCFLTQQANISKRASKPAS